MEKLQGREPDMLPVKLRLDQLPGGRYGHGRNQELEIKGSPQRNGSQESARHPGQRLGEIARRGDLPFEPDVPFLLFVFMQGIVKHGRIGTRHKTVADTQDDFGHHEPDEGVGDGVDGKPQGSEDAAQKERLAASPYVGHPA